MDALYRFRDWVGIPPALLVLLLLLAIPARHVMSKFSDGHFQVTIEAPSPPASPPKPEPALPSVSPPAPTPAYKTTTSRRTRDASAPRARPRPIAAPPVPTSQPPREVLEPSEVPLASAPARTLAAEERPAPVEPPAPVLPPAPPQETKGIRAEEAYIAQIRSNVQSRKKYPTGREASVQKPSGTVRACMDLNRIGVPATDIVIERTSHSMILDAEARKLLRSGAYPPFPAGAFPGESTHRFCIHLEYAFQSSG